MPILGDYYTSRNFYNTLFTLNFSEYIDHQYETWKDLKKEIDQSLNELDNTRSDLTERICNLKKDIEKTEKSKKKKSHKQKSHLASCKKYETDLLDCTDNLENVDDTILCLSNELKKILSNLEWIGEIKTYLDRIYRARRNGRDSEADLHIEKILQMEIPNTLEWNVDLNIYVVTFDDMA